MINCTESQTVERERIHCPTCERDYALYRVTHVCNPVVQCKFNNKVKYTEEYLPYSIPVSSTLVCVCNACEEITHAQTAPQKNMCPKCDYVGWYVSDESKLCPVCKLPPAPKKQKKPDTTVSDLINTSSCSFVVREIQLTPLPTLRLYCNVELVPKADSIAARLNSRFAVVPDPTTHECVSISLNGMNSDLIAADKWVTENWHSAIDVSMGLTPPVVMSSLYDYISDLRAKYILQWHDTTANGLAKFWILHLFNKHGPEKKDLGINI
jgi:hypothetical protein